MNGRGYILFLAAVLLSVAAAAWVKKPGPARAYASAYEDPDHPQRRQIQRPRCPRRQQTQWAEAEFEDEPLWERPARVNNRRRETTLYRRD